MDKKTYKFFYGGTKKKIVSKFLNLLTNTAVGIFYAFIIDYIFYLLSKDLNSNTSINYLKYLEYLIIFSEILFFVVISLLPQKVVIEDDYIKVYKFSYFGFVVSGFSGFSGIINDKIKISNIENIKILPKQRKSNLPNSLPPIIICWGNLIEIEAETLAMFYCIQIENPDDYINEVKKRQSMIENNHTFGAKAPTNMFQFDLQRGYMPDCDEIVLGINGVEFKTDKATAGLINVKSISYNDIQLCKKSDRSTANGVDSDNIVEITTANQTYYIPIKKPYDFINELYKKLTPRNR